MKIELKITVFAECGDTTLGAEVDDRPAWSTE